MSRQSIGLENEPSTLGDRVKTLAAGTTVLNAADHAGRLLLAAQAAAAVTVVLPEAVGSGNVYKVLNTVARTSGALTFKVNTATSNIINVAVKSFDSTAVATDTSSWFLTNASQIALNITTTGGLGGDWFEFTDGAVGVWYARGETRCSGDKATPLTATTP
jgi:hypothetical protein